MTFPPQSINRSLRFLIAFKQTLFAMNCIYIRKNATTYFHINKSHYTNVTADAMVIIVSGNNALLTFDWVCWHCYYWELHIKIAGDFIYFAASCNSLLTSYPFCPVLNENPVMTREIDFCDSEIPAPMGKSVQSFYERRI